MPDANPFLARVLAKTFVREPGPPVPDRRRGNRRPDRVPRADRTPWTPAGGTWTGCKLDVAAWSTTGMVRSGNEDAVAVYHTGEGRLDDADEAALILLADGMGGMESGEVAAALALQTLRQCLLAGPPFAASLPPTPLPEHARRSVDRSATEAPEPVPRLPPSRAAMPAAAAADPDSPERTADAHAERVDGRPAGGQPAGVRGGPRPPRRSRHGLHRRGGPDRRRRRPSSATSATAASTACAGAS